MKQFKDNKYLYEVGGKIYWFTGCLVIGTATNIETDNLCGIHVPIEMGLSFKEAVSKVVPANLVVDIISALFEYNAEELYYAYRKQIELSQ